MSNPLISEKVFENAERASAGMTVSGTINKSIFLLIILLAGAYFPWTYANIFMPYIWVALIAGFVLAMISIFKQAASPLLSPVYAACEGIVLGLISVSFNKSYPGIVINAVLLTTCALLCMLGAYKTGLLKATPMFRKVVIIATLSIAVVYLIDILLSAFGAGRFPYINDSGTGGIIISLVIVTIASFNLILDFDMIEKGARRGAPKYFEWYCAFSLMVTLVWLYLEMLRLLAKTRD
ncbi:Bax inhibitor-1/YccA family membrane protein [Endomicrobium proavitum]|uniref:Bax inhibitor-1/YccA family protein n=1 Tax=Endomicrobium proavitum TaxID=1408281 RepID=A0A0G3WIZ4_9BACT|nr:Bax inhibitor-1/YccA family protein [Endomicrobium proavitum]AKL98293.1 conserved membrane protein of unknown function [Endomicrobium proavitum]